VGGALGGLLAAFAADDIPYLLFRRDRINAQAVNDSFLTWWRQQSQVAAKK
jgi:hypothetical protein